MLFNKHRCYKGGTEHNFAPRYNREEITAPVSNEQMETIMRNTFHGDTAEVLESMKLQKTTYIHDICVWCGAIRRSGDVTP